MRHEGRVQQALRRRLYDKGFDVDFFIVPRGYWRSDHRADVYRWEANGRFNGVPGKAYCASWFTMSECVSKGIVLEPDEDGPAGHFDVSVGTP